ncbi:MAG: IS110 family transposase [Gammaproteobacteria bacterium CG11_big_fil_rev_8_21_14_0_20_46_22]|nr:MAG: IS110 family transposase [Gammaproteobacteria bacterium CG12_big_fil_rev_8_21_14_0_65_46_12]PIR10066.1 MAG: IS110 family transposase [Gammaproteobacteria bacterium CG11_big_fil_rev_8_21_14_0_20_46_22]
MNITLVGIDVAKTVFQLCCANEHGKIIARKRLQRAQLLQKISQILPCTIVMEACGSANYWAREFEQLGHTVKLIAPQYVKPFVKGNKNDYRDAEAIVEAAQRPHMRFVTHKTVEQQDLQSLLRIREMYVTMRTRATNQLRGLLAEYGHAIPQGLATLRKVLPKLYDREVINGLSVQLKALLEQQYNTLLQLDQEIAVCDNKLKAFVKKDDRCERLMEIPGIGVISAAALVALVGTGAGFKNGRHFAAYLGLVPKQHSSGNTQKLLGISKRGDEFARRMLIHGARSVVIRSKNKPSIRSTWVERLRNEKGINRACVALANKNARIAMAILLSGERYQEAA